MAHFQDEFSKDREATLEEVKKFQEIEEKKNQLIAGLRQISEELWKELEELLNRVANERQQDSTGPGSGPSDNARGAYKIIKKLGMERRKPSNIL